MNANFIPTPQASTAAALLRALRDFALDNVDQLEWLLAACGAHQQLAAFRHLVEDLHDHGAAPEDAYLIFSEIRDQLGALPVHKPFAYLQARPDLEACIRWLGGQLDSILADTEGL